MAQSDKTSLPEEIEENIDVFSEELEKVLHFNDFVWVENTKPKIMQGKDDQNDEKQSEIITNSVAIVAPHESFRESGGDMVLSQIKYSDIMKTDGEAVVTTDLDKELLVEQEYWEQHESVAKKMSNIKMKHHTSQRRTLKEHKIIDITVTTPRHLSYYQFGKATMDTLEHCQHWHYVGQYLKFAGRGLNSVVFYSPSPLYRRPILPCGIAVKMYKVSSDVRKNSTILKKAEREGCHLSTFNNYNRCVPENGIHCLVPQGFHRFQNVTVMQFIGVNTKPAPSINTLPLERSKEVYDMMVEQLHLWYYLQIVHGKLSSKYVRLWHTKQTDTPREPWLNKPYVLGWSHAVRTDHPQALKKLMRDCRFVTEFFKRRGVPVTSTEELFKNITDIKKLSRPLLDEIYGKNLWPDHHLTNPNRTSDGQCRPHSTSRFKAK